MKHVIMLSLISFLLCLFPPLIPPGGHSLSPAALAAVPEVVDEFLGEVVDVEDGDTIRVLRAGEAVEVRLAGVDAPEEGQAYSKIARDGLAHAIHGKVVDVRVLGRDIDNCLLGRVYLGDLEINVELVKAGLAWYSRQRRLTDKAFGEAQKMARKEKRGIWQPGPRPVPPWEFRRLLEEAERVDSNDESGQPGYIKPKG